jgi:hypothetical protein
MPEARNPDAAVRPPDGSLESAVLRRLEDFERENQRLRRLGIYVLGVVGALLGLAAAFVVVAARHGMPGFVPQVTESRRFVVRDAEGRIRAAMGTNADGTSQLLLQDEGGKERLRMSVLADGGAGVAFVDSAGRSRMVLGLLPDQSASVVLADGGGKTRTVLTLSPNGASTILFADKGGTTRAGLGVDGRGIGTFTLVDRSGGDLSNEPPEGAVDTSPPPADTSPPPASPPSKRR